MTMDTIYIYTSDTYGNPGPYLTTLPQLQADLDELAESEGWEKVELSERLWATDRPPVIVDQDGEIIAEAATLESLETYQGTPGGALWWEVVARATGGALAGLLGKTITYGQARRVMGVYDQLTKEEVIRMQGFYASGGNGSYVELEDGRYADTVVGETSEPEEAHEALNRLCKLPGIDWIGCAEWQYWSNYDNDVLDIDEYVAIDK